MIEYKRARTLQHRLAVGLSCGCIQPDLIIVVQVSQATEVGFHGFLERGNLPRPLIGARGMGRLACRRSDSGQHSLCLLRGLGVRVCWLAPSAACGRYTSCSLCLIPRTRRPSLLVGQGPCSVCADGLFSTEPSEGLVMFGRRRAGRCRKPQNCLKVSAFHIFWNVMTCPGLWSKGRKGRPGLPARRLGTVVSETDSEGMASESAGWP